MERDAVDPPATKLDGDEAEQMFEALSDEPKYRQLEARVIERGEQLRPDDATAIRVDGEIKAVLVDVPIVDTDADEGHLAIGRDENTGEIVAAALEYDEEHDTGGTIEKTTLDATDSPSSFEKRVQTIDPNLPYDSSDFTP